MMNYNVYAIVLDNEIVNLIVAENIFKAMDSAKIHDAEKATAVECTDYKCSIGDYCIDGIFYYKDKKTRIPNTSVEVLLGELSISNATLEQSIGTLLQSNADIEIALCELAMLIEGGE